MNEENNSKIKTKLLIEILCMVIIYGLHSQQIEHVLNYYLNSQRIQLSYYYHPIIFFQRVKDILFDCYYMIGSSKCLETAIIEYKSYI